MNKYRFIALLLLAPFIAVLILVLTNITYEQANKLGDIVLLIILIFSIFIYHRHKNILKELSNTVRILYEDVNLPQYITKMQYLMAKTSNDTLKKYMLIDLALGYNANGETKKAIEIMESMNIKGLIHLNKAIYYNNLVYYYLNINNISKAMEVYSLGDVYFKRLSIESPISANLLFTKALITYFQGNLEDSEQLMEKAKMQRGNSIHLLTEINLYLAKIYSQSGRIEKAKLLLDYNMAQKLYPIYYFKTKTMLEELSKE